MEMQSPSFAALYYADTASAVVGVPSSDTPDPKPLTGLACSFTARLFKLAAVASHTIESRLHPATQRSLIRYYRKLHHWHYFYDMDNGRLKAYPCNLSDK